MAFSPGDRYLAVGTQCGILAIWRYIGPGRDLTLGGGGSGALPGAAGGLSSKGASVVPSEGAMISPSQNQATHPASHVTPSSNSDWEVYYKMALPHPVLHIEWGGGKGTLGVVTEESTIIFTEALLNR